MFSLLIWMLIGGLVGWMACIMAHSPSIGCLGDIMAGVAGALMGGAVLSLLLPGEYSFAGFNLGSLVMALLGAIISLLIVRAMGWDTRERER